MLYIARSQKIKISFTAFIEDLRGGRTVCRIPEFHTRFPGAQWVPPLATARPSSLTSARQKKFGGICNLRMDDTNPHQGRHGYVEPLEPTGGFDWAVILRPDYFEKTYAFAGLITKGLAYVCELTPEQFREYRGRPDPPPVSPTGPAGRRVSDLFRRMRAGIP